MAIYHFAVKVVSRGKGSSAVAKAAYNGASYLRLQRGTPLSQRRALGRPSWTRVLRRSRANPTLLHVHAAGEPWTEGFQEAGARHSEDSACEQQQNVAPLTGAIVIPGS
jgi:hypothetical protein